jgi:hypothetical protein
MDYRTSTTGRRNCEPAIPRTSPLGGRATTGVALAKGNTGSILRTRDYGSYSNFVIRSAEKWTWELPLFWSAVARHRFGPRRLDAASYRRIQFTKAATHRSRPKRCRATALQREAFGIYSRRGCLCRIGSRLPRGSWRERSSGLRRHL